MGKISKLMKLLSTSAVVAGANSVALADCGLCGDKTYDHGTDACPHFDYRGYGLSKGYKPETLPDNEFLGKLALADRKNADAFLNIPTSNASSLDNTWSNTETTIQSSNEKPGASDKLNALKFERTQDLEDRATTVSESDAEEMTKEVRSHEEDRQESRALAEAAEQTRGEDLQRLFNEENARKEEAVIAQKKAGRRTRAKRLAERAQNNIARHDAERTSGRDLQNLFDEDNARKEEARIAKTKEARARDSEELQGMLKDYRSKSRDAIDLEARDLHLQAHLKRNENARRRSERLAKEEARKELNSMIAERLEADREATRAERTERAQELKEKANALAESKKAAREQANAAEKIQNARRAQLARRKADLLRKQEETRKDNAALKITEALRKNKERKEAQRQAQINGDYELAKKLQAEYDAEDRQIRADRLLAEQEQLRENLKAVPVEEAQNGEDFKYESEEAQINSDSVLAAQEQAREYLETEAVAQERTSVAASAGDTDEEVGTDSWTIPPFVQDAFRGYDLEYNRNRADRWARGLNRLSIRELEAMFWLTAIPCKQMMNEGIRMEENIAEAVTAVDGIFPYSGTSAAILNVYNAFEHTETAEFSGGLERLGINELNAVLYYIADQYMHRLMSGKKAASDAFIQLAKAAFECFDAVWEADNAQVVADASSEKKVSGGKAAVSNEITETEPQETQQWNPPYRVYYAYCIDIMDGLLPSRGSRNVKRNPELFKTDLRARSIRQTEVLIYLASGIYKDGLRNGASPLNNEITRCVEDVDNVFPKIGQGEPNVRVMNVYNALKNMLDKPNNNPISMQPFQKGFKALTPDERVMALCDMAVAYREKLRNGARPASMVFVNWANAICKEFNLDGFMNGKDNVHPELTFEEFGNEAKQSQISDAANANGNSAVVAKKPGSDWVPTEWEMPEGVYDALEFQYGRHTADGRHVSYYQQSDADTENEGQARGRLEEGIKELNVRQLEALLGVTVATYAQKLRENNGSPISKTLLDQATAIWQLILGARRGDNERLLNVLETLDKADNKGDFQGDVKRLPLRQIEAFIGMIALVYDDKLDEGAEPAGESFKKFSHDVCKLLYLKYWDEDDEDEATNDPHRNALEDDNRVLVEPVGA